MRGPVGAAAERGLGGCAPPSGPLWGGEAHVSRSSRPSPGFRGALPASWGEAAVCLLRRTAPTRGETRMSRV